MATISSLPKGTRLAPFVRRALTARGAYTFGGRERGIRVESWLGPPTDVSQQKHWKSRRKHFEAMAAFVEWYSEFAKRDHDAYLALQVLYAAVESLEFAVVAPATDPLAVMKKQRINDLYAVVRSHETVLQEIVARTGPLTAATLARSVRGSAISLLEDRRREYSPQHDGRRPKAHIHARTRELAAKIAWVLKHSNRGGGLRWAGRKARAWPGVEREWRSPARPPDGDLISGLGHRIFELASETLADCRARDLDRGTAMRVARRLVDKTPISVAVAATWLAGEMGLYEWDLRAPRNRKVREAQDLAKQVFARQPRALSLPPAGAGYP